MAGCARVRLGYAHGMRQRVLVLLGTLWVGAAVVGHVQERRGAIACACREDCWCKKPGIGLFRWALPVGHNLP